MAVEQDHIYPIYHELVSREEKEKMIGQKSKVIWFTGLSGAGKSTLAKSYQKYLHQEGFLTYVLDGDNLRSGLNSNLTFSLEDREENLRRAAETARLFVDAGIITLASFITPTNEIRQTIKSIIGEDLINVYVKASVETCSKRDVKGLYEKAFKGEISNFTGVDSPFEDFSDADIIIDTDEMDLQKSMAHLIEELTPSLNLD